MNKPYTCRTCRFWCSARAPGIAEDSPAVCQHPAVSAWHAWPFRSETVMGGDGGALSTGPDFGCVHWTSGADPLRLTP